MTSSGNACCPARCGVVVSTAHRVLVGQHLPWLTFWGRATGELLRRCERDLCR
ncbi:hypothetical protein FHX42_001102 [Saccharopolyspora lacisalsi]|uniref:Uncharacterized protein n=1 Tax=Halosaccharopolyspora lacisalsi TaxID=1000566 RepID=A0A839DRS1_9PSEU|nr:hypothetical protein [Halosaccharopolyspora lacisalsi]